MGLDVYLYSKAEHESDDLHQDVPSEKYPDHLFNRRYLRSSYNGSGFNRAVPDFIGPESDLYAIFEPLGNIEDSDKPQTSADVPAWRDVKARALDVAERLRASDRLRSESFGRGFIGSQPHMWSALPTEAEVLAWFRESQVSKSPHMSGGYSNAKGSIFPDGLTVLAITAGQHGPVVVYQAEREVLDNYIQSAEITAEFCDEAIALIKRDGCAYMYWSA